jgi:hypothetical protein
MMKMEHYLKTIEGVKELKDWINRLRRFRSRGEVFIWPQYFEFDTPELTFMLSALGELVAVGPIYNLNWPMQHRLVALFIPSGVKPSIFYPFMPPQGTFKFNPQAYGLSLREKYHLSLEQEEEAIGSLSRCGKYVTRVTVPGSTNVTYLYSISVQKDLLYMTSLKR